MTSTIGRLLCALFCMVAICANAYAAGAGTVRFVASQTGVSLDGTFDKFAANVRFDPAQPNVGTAQITVDVGSVGTGNASADLVIRGEDFFSAAKFPQATFEASDFHAQDKEHYVAKGTFTLKGHSAPLSIVFTTRTDPQGQWFDGSFTVSRLQFGVGLGEWADTSTLDDPVQIQFHILQPKALR